VAEDDRLEDMIRLAVKGPPLLTGAVRFHAKLVVPPGGQDVVERMILNGEFNAVSARFSNINIQEKINKLSHGGKGEPEEPPSDTVAGDYKILCVNVLRCR